MVDPAGQGQVALARQQALAGQVDGHQRGAAGGLHVHAGAGQVEQEAGAGAEEVLVVAGVAQQEHAHAADQLGVRAEVEIEVAAHPAAGEHPHRPADGLGRVAGVLQRLPGGLQEVPVLGVQDGRLLGREAEELAVELLQVGQRGAGPDVVGPTQVGRVLPGGQQLLVGVLRGWTPPRPAGSARMPGSRGRPGARMPMPTMAMSVSAMSACHHLVRSQVLGAVWLAGPCLLIVSHGVAERRPPSSSYFNVVFGPAWLHIGPTAVSALHINWGGARSGHAAGSMAIRIVPHGEEHRDRRGRLQPASVQPRAGNWGSTSSPCPTGSPPRPARASGGNTTWPVDAEGERPRGLRPEASGMAVIGKEVHTVADWQGPVSEGQVDPKYGALALRMMRQMLKQRPLLYSFGHGGAEERVIQLVKEMGWVHDRRSRSACGCSDPGRSCRKARVLRSTAARAIWPLTRWPRPAWAASACGRCIWRCRNSGIGDVYVPLHVAVESSFGPWADDVWRGIQPTLRGVGGA